MMKSIRERNDSAAGGRVVFALALGVFLCVLPAGIPAAAQPAPCSSSIKTDRAVYPEPPLPALPPAGGKFCDPTFGAEIMRATDAAECPAPGCGTYYSQWPTFNSDNTRLLIRKGQSGDVLIKEFNPATFTLGPTLRSTPTLPGGHAVQWQGAMWSRTDPDLIYAHANYYNSEIPSMGMKLYTYRPSTDAFVLLEDFEPKLDPAHHGQPDYPFEMHVDAHDEIFTLMHRRIGAAGNPIYFIVWRRSDKTILHHIPNTAAFFGATEAANAAIPDKSGRWIAFPLNADQAAQPGDVRMRILDLKNNTWQTIFWLDGDDPASHGDLGTGIMVGHGHFSGAGNVRSLGDARNPARLFDYKDANGTTDWSNDQHLTLYADNEDWAMMGLYDYDNTRETGAYEDEVMQYSTSDAQSFRRLFHHRSHVVDSGGAGTDGYQSIPKPTISRNGRFIAFTSNWENSGRYDLFIAKIEPAPVLTPQPPTELAATAIPAPGLQVSLTWTAPPGSIQHYEVMRRQSIDDDYQPVSQPTTASYTDAGVSPGTTYLYCVSAVYASGATSACSNVGLATTVIFADDPLNVLAPTTIKAQHIAELRQAVNAVRAAAGMGPAAWTGSPPVQQFGIISAQHFLELRANLNPALSALDLPTLPADPTLGAGQRVRAAHGQDVRDRVR